MLIIELFLDQYNSLRANKSAVPLCSDAETVKEISSTERTALMMTQEVSYKCPPPCTTNQYEGSVTRFQSGEGKLRNGVMQQVGRGEHQCVGSKIETFSNPVIQVLRSWDKMFKVLGL